MSRLLMLLAIFAGPSSQLKLLHLPILLMTQWSGALVKIWTQMNLVKQKWTNRGNQSIDAGGTAWRRWCKGNLAQFLFGSQLVGFGICVLWLNGLVNPIQELQGWQLQSESQALVQSTERIEAVDYGVRPNDGRDDAAALETLIAQAATAHLEIQLPIGELEFRHPLKVQRGQVTLQGQGKGRTVILLEQPAIALPASTPYSPPNTAPLADSTARPEQAMAFLVSSDTAPPESLRVRGLSIRLVPTLPKRTSS